MAPARDQIDPAKSSRGGGRRPDPKTDTPFLARKLDDLLSLNQARGRRDFATTRWILAEFLGIDSGNVTNWQTRNQIPTKYLRGVLTHLGVAEALLVTADDEQWSAWVRDGTIPEPPARQDPWGDLKAQAVASPAFVIESLGSSGTLEDSRALVGGADLAAAWPRLRVGEAFRLRIDLASVSRDWGERRPDNALLFEESVNGPEVRLQCLCPHQNTAVIPPPVIKGNEFVVPMGSAGGLTLEDPPGRRTYYALLLAGGLTVHQVAQLEAGGGDNVIAMMRDELAPEVLAKDPKQSPWALLKQDIIVTV